MLLGACSLLGFLLALFAICPRILAKTFRNNRLSAFLARLETSICFFFYTSPSLLLESHLFSSSILPPHCPSMQTVLRKYLGFFLIWILLVLVFFCALVWILLCPPPPSSLLSHSFPSYPSLPLLEEEVLVSLVLFRGMSETDAYAECTHPRNIHPHTALLTHFPPVVSTSGSSIVPRLPLIFYFPHSGGKYAIIFFFAAFFLI